MQNDKFIARTITCSHLFPEISYLDGFYNTKTLQIDTNSESLIYPYNLSNIYVVDLILSWDMRVGWY